jgi:methylated-DNA-[protein]-cysteine S-methyltransferase
MGAIRWTVHDSPIGELTLVAGEEGLGALGFERPRVPPGATKAPMSEITEQIDAYFAGELRQFDLALDLRGTPLERAVWQGLLEIPYGETATYGQQAARIEAPLFDSEIEPWQRARAVGAANGRNPVAIVVPCHRVIGADGSLTGYAGGLHRKQALLDLEQSRQLAFL